MKLWERDLAVTRIISGCRKVRIDNNTYKVITPSRESRAFACEVYAEAYNEGLQEGVFTEEEALGELIRLNLWGDNDDRELDVLTSNIENAKVSLYENMFRSSLRISIKRTLGEFRKRSDVLLARKNSLSHSTCETIAAISKSRYLTGCSILRHNGPPLWGDPDEGWGSPDEVIDKIIEYLADSRLTESTIRELARNDPWRTINSLSKHSGSGVFGVGSSDLSDEQASLLSWGVAYESIREHPECPDDEVIEDDDSLDGWLIIQKRKRATSSHRDDFAAGDEVFVMADSPQDAARINQLNSTAAKMEKSQRLAKVRAEGIVDERG